MLPNGEEGEASELSKALVLLHAALPAHLFPAAQLLLHGESLEGLKGKRLALYSPDEGVCAVQAKAKIKDMRCNSVVRQVESLPPWSTASIPELDQICRAADSLYYRQYAFLKLPPQEVQKIADIKDTLSSSEPVLERQGLQHFPERVVRHFKPGERQSYLSVLQQPAWLKVVNTKTGLFEDVLVPEGYILVLPGYTLQRATCGIYKAAAHQVTMRDVEGGRLAVAFKLRSPDTALLDFHTALIAAGKQIEARFAGPIRVIELLAMFDEMHPSINDAGSRQSYKQFPGQAVRHFNPEEHQVVLSVLQQPAWLEVVNTMTGLFKGVLLPEGYVLVLLGYTLQRWRATCGIYKTVHFD
ncbi:MAG: hypothetical protein FRX49_07028 [Trebouxia sp. A1-2]|nr:MAG: hypothetical protein FRX49_07028 [Trebouxia sp. A1-2]